MRNAVTAGAALGVGVTLFFSYRRQQVAEQTQRVAADAQVTAANAQQTAAAALELSNKQHALDQERRKDSISRNLRERYAQVAEHLGSEREAVRLAGVYSLAALGDDWFDAVYPHEQQVCVDLLAAFVRSTGGLEDEHDRQELQSAILQTILRRLIPPKEGSSRFWGSCSIRLDGLSEFPWLSNVLITDKGSLSVDGTKVSRWGYMRKLRLSGRLELINVEIAGRLSISDCVITRSGTLRLRGSSPGEDDPRARRSVVIENLHLEGGKLLVHTSGVPVFFRNCKFKAGSLSVRVGTAVDISFRGCEFEGDVLQAPASIEPLEARLLSIDAKTSFAPGVKPLRTGPVEPLIGYRGFER